jgi:hypothetical protein
MAPDLAEKMRLRADADKLPADHALRIKADAFEEACKGYYATPQTVTVGKFMGCWARARSAWCEYSGEPLI